LFGKIGLRDAEFAAGVYRYESSGIVHDVPEALEIRGLPILFVKGRFCISMTML